jgi:DNA-binding SARP family transcriptional activator
MRNVRDEAPTLLRLEPAQWPVLICQLGGYQLLKDGHPVALKSGGKAELLLTLLVLEEGLPLTRDLVLERLWPDTELQLAAQSLHSLIYSLQKQLSDALHGEPPIVYSEGRYQVNEPVGVGSDIWLFESLTEAAQRHARQNDIDHAVELCRRAIDLYRGDLVASDGMRAIIEREQLRARYLTMLARLAGHYFGRANYAACLNVVQRVLASDPCREDAHRLVMLCHLRLGERAQALRQYRLCQEMLRAEFDAEPEQETTQLFDRIRLNPSGI